MKKLHGSPQHFLASNECQIYLLLTILNPTGPVWTFENVTVRALDSSSTVIERSIIENPSAALLCSIASNSQSTLSFQPGSEIRARPGDAARFARASTPARLPAWSSCPP